LSVEVVRKPKKPLPENVGLSAGLRTSLAKEGIKVDWQGLIAPRGFRVLPRARWVVERTFAWTICHNRRMAIRL